jgi:hypothetical protein
MASNRTIDEARDILESVDPRIYDVRTHATGPVGALPLDDEMLRHWAC